MKRVLHQESSSVTQEGDSFTQYAVMTFYGQTVVYKLHKVGTFNSTFTLQKNICLEIDKTQEGDFCDMR